MADLQLAPQPHLFQWNVAMVDTPRQPSDANPTQAPTPPSPPMQAESAQIQPPHPIQTTIETQSVVGPVHPVERVARQEPVQTRPVPRTISQETVATAETPQTVSRSAQIVDTAEPSTPVLPAQSTDVPVTDGIPVEKESAVMPAPHETAAEQILAKAPSSSASESTVVSHSKVDAMPPPPTAQERAANETTSTITESMTDVEHAKAVELPATESSSVSKLPIRSTSSLQEVETTTAQPFIQEKVPGPLAPEPSPVQELPRKSRPAVKADFGWLTRALLSRIQQLKRYPHTARVNHWEGKVVLRAVIGQDVRVIRVDIAESSGDTELDEDAVEVMKKTSPLELTHPIEQSQVVVRVPIRYKLE